MSDQHPEERRGARWEDGEIIERGPGTHDATQAPLERPDPTEAPLPADDEERLGVDRAEG
ncbi:hypothetical protein [Deinococcus pimensis]|uniref:hypothetical protein n=1 Tax=Deinococcus pimensis TaxID=309888 RepID=UPI000480D7A7|nr:hypothetical protein [Deinococcus pimensis]